MIGNGKTCRPDLRMAGAAVVLVLAISACGDAAGDSWAVTSSPAQAEITAGPASTQSTTSTTTTAGSATTGGTDDGAGGDYTATETSYTSATTSISIGEVTLGSGSNTITYYVADVVLASATDLQAAFAGGEFGRGLTEDTSDIAASHDAVLAVNGDAAEVRADGIVIRNGVLYRDLPTRTGLAIYAGGRVEVYDETQTSGGTLLAAGVWNTYSFGPALLVDGVITANPDTVEVEAHPQHPIQGSQPRTGIGVIDANHVVFIVVDGRSPGYSRGVTLAEFAAIFRDLGCTIAYNLDGGVSSSMYFMGELVNNPLGRNRERGVEDILFVA